MSCNVVYPLNNEKPWHRATKYEIATAILSDCFIVEVKEPIPYGTIAYVSGGENEGYWRIGGRCSLECKEWYKEKQHYVNQCTRRRVTSV